MRRTSGHAHATEELSSADFHLEHCFAPATPIRGRPIPVLPRRRRRPRQRGRAPQHRELGHVALAHAPRRQRQPQLIPPSRLLRICERFFSGDFPSLGLAAPPEHRTRGRRRPAHPLPPSLPPRRRGGRGRDTDRDRESAELCARPRAGVQGVGACTRTARTVVAANMNASMWGVDGTRSLSPSAHPSALMERRGWGQVQGAVPRSSPAARKRLVVLYASEEAIREARDEDRQHHEEQQWRQCPDETSCRSASPTAFVRSLSGSPDGRMTVASRVGREEEDEDGSANHGAESVDVSLARHVLLGNSSDIVIGAQYDAYGNRTHSGNFLSGSEGRRLSVVGAQNAQAILSGGVRCPSHVVDCTQHPLLQKTDKRMQRKKASLRKPAAATAGGGGEAVRKKTDPSPPANARQGISRSSPAPTAAGGAGSPSGSWRCMSSPGTNTGNRSGGNGSGGADFIEHESPTVKVIQGSSLPPQRLIQKHADGTQTQTEVQPVQNPQPLEIRRPISYRRPRSATLPPTSLRGGEASGRRDKTASADAAGFPDDGTRILRAAGGATATTPAQQRRQELRRDTSRPSSYYYVRPASATASAQLGGRPLSARNRSVRVPTMRTPTVEEKARSRERPQNVYVKARLENKQFVYTGTADMIV